HNAVLRLDHNGDLVVGTGSGIVRFHKPVVYQPEAGAENLTMEEESSSRKGCLIKGRYRLKGNHVTFEVASYDKRRPLVIDATLAYSTYLGGSGSGGDSFGDEGHGIAVDGSGNAYIIGDTDSADFPTTRGAFQTSDGGDYDAFVSKLNADGSAML